MGFYALSLEDMRHLRWDGDEDVTKVVGQPSEKGRPLRSETIVASSVRTRAHWRGGTQR